jgi:FSR family fosmidomycin resistance protein-like MFS transporter
VANEPARFDRDEKQILLFTGVAHGLTHYVELAYPTLAVILAAQSGLPIERVLGWSLIGYSLFGFGALPAGLLADRFGGRRVILGGMLLAGASTLAGAFSTPGWPLALCLAGMGLGASAYHPAGMALISRGVAARGTALGINGIYGNVGIALAPLITSLLGDAFGWRFAMGVTGAGVILAVLAGSTLSFPEPSFQAPQAPQVPPADEESRASRSAPRIHIAVFLLLCGAAMFAGFTYRANTVALPALFSQNLHIMDFGLAVGIAMFTGTLAQYLGGRIADRYSLGWSYVAFHAASLPFLLFITLTSELPLVISASLFAFFALGMQPIENSLFADLTPDHWRSRAYGLKFTLTFGIGSTAVVMVRQVGDASGFIGVYQVLMGVVLATVLLAFCVAWLRPKIVSLAAPVIVAASPE